MEFVTRRPLSAQIPFFSRRSATETVATPQPESPDPQLAQLIKNQKRVNDLIHICDLDTNGKLNCRWVKACLL